MYKKRLVKIDTPSFWENKEKVFYINKNEKIKAIHKSYLIPYETLTKESFTFYFNDDKDELKQTNKDVWLHFVQLMIQDTEEKFIDNLKQEK